MSSEATIRRGVRNARYAAIPNHVFEDDRLSMEARWLLSYLLSKPDHWVVRIGDIVSKGRCGRDKARQMIAELVRFGYAEREQQRADGKFGASVLVVFDEPQAIVSAEDASEHGSVANLPQTDLPATALPAPVSPSPVKSAHSNNSDLANTDDQNLRERGHAADEGRQDRAVWKKNDAGFWDFVKDWPQFAGMGKEPARKLWHELSDDERRAAVDGYAGWRKVLERDKKSHVPAPQTYFRDKLWLAVPAPVIADRSERVMVKPFGKMWSALRLVDLLGGPTGRISALTFSERKQVAEGLASEAEIMRRRVQQMGWPTVNSMLAKARDREGYVCPVALETASVGFVSVERGSEVWQAWAAEHERRNWPFYDPAPQYAYFPSIEMGEDLATAVRAAVDRFDFTTEDFRKSRVNHDAA